jgi:hypothetical protein
MEDKLGMRKKPRELPPAAASVRLVETEAGEGGVRPISDAKGRSRVTDKQKPAVRLVKPAPKAPPPEVADHVSRRLKAVYDDVLNQPIPDRFLDLLKVLDADGKK